MVFILAYILCAMLGFGIYAYRGSNDSDEIIGLIFTAPLGLAYQTGALARDVQRRR